ncbi:hypothetical protein KGQ31_00510 [Patescibacteria group bacterium]|nr:hypothetical protein [Patescibacteria group bacterium]
MKTSSLLVLAALLCVGCRTARVRETRGNLPAGSLTIINKTPFSLELSDGGYWISGNPPDALPTGWRVIIRPRETRVLKDLDQTAIPATIGIRAFEIERAGCIILPHNMGNCVRSSLSRNGVRILTVRRRDLR